MHHYQTVVENIRNRISYFGSLPDEQVRTLADSYAEAVQEINERLLHCSQMIRSGNSSEAVRLAEIEPDLLESYALLDFPEKIQWSELVRSRGAAVPPPLFEELAREINDAYTTVNPLQPLLKKHRHLAVARAPLAQRIAVLRELVLMEPDNLDWKHDLESYEKARYRELEHDVQQAVAAKDVDRMTALLRELDPKQWTSPPPETFSAQLRRTLKTESQRALKIETEQLVGKLRRAYETENVDQAVKYADRWDRLTGELGRDVPLDWKVDVQAALLWVEEKRRQREQVREFELQLQRFRAETYSGGDTERLASDYARLEAMAGELDREIPEPILRLYESKLHSHEVRGTRRFRVLLVALILFSAVLATGLVLGVRHFQRQNEIRQIAIVMQSYLDRKDFDTADQYFQEQKSRLEQFADSPILIDVYSELKTAVEREKERRILFRDSMNRARESLKSGTIDELALTQAQSRAQNDSEKFELRTLENEYRRMLAEAQNRVDFSLRQLLDPVLLELQPLQAERGREDDGTLGKLNDLLKKALDARNIAGASFDVQNERERLIGRIEQWIGEINQRKESRGDLADLTKTVANPVEYAQTLQTLAAKYPNLPVTKDFTMLLKELPAWNLVEKWNRLVDVLPGAGGRTKGESLEEECKKLDTFLADWQRQSGEFADFPEHAAVEYNVPYMRAKTRRIRNGQFLLTEMEKEFRRIASRPFWLHRQEKTGVRYYLTAPPKVGRNKYLADKKGTERSLQLTELAVAGIVAKGEAPHVRFAKLALEEFEKIKSSDGAAWRDAACTLLQHIQDDPDYDPLLRFIQLRDLIKLFSEGDLSVQKSYAMHLSTLEDGISGAAGTLGEFVDWIDPKSEDAAAERKLAEEILARLPTSRSALEATQKDADMLRNHPISQYERIGWAEKTDENTWICSSHRTSLPRDGLVVFRGNEAENGKVSMRLESVGVLDGNVKRIAASAGLLFGTPIYLKTTCPYSQKE